MPRELHDQWALTFTTGARLDALQLEPASVVPAADSNRTSLATSARRRASGPARCLAHALRPPCAPTL